MEKENKLIVHKIDEYSGYWGTTDNLNNFKQYNFEESDFIDELVKDLVEIGLIKAENVKIFDTLEFYKHIEIVL